MNWSCQNMFWASNGGCKLKKRRYFWLTFQFICSHRNVPTKICPVRDIYQIEDFCCWFFDIGKQYFFKNQLKKSKIHQAMFCGKFSSYNYRIFCTIFTHGNNIYFHHNTRAIHKFSLVVTTTDLLTHNNTLFT